MTLALLHGINRITLNVLLSVFYIFHTDTAGFYVKTGQIISTRVDIFPVEYTSKLASTLDNLDPLPAKVIRGINTITFNCSLICSLLDYCLTLTFPSFIFCHIIDPITSKSA